MSSSRKRRKKRSVSDEEDPPHILCCLPDVDDPTTQEKEEIESQERRQVDTEKKTARAELITEVKRKALPVSQAKRILYRIMDQIAQNTTERPVSTTENSTREKIQAALLGKPGPEVQSGQIKIPKTVSLDPKRALKLKEEAMQTYAAYQRMYASEHDAAIQKQAAEAADKKLRKLLEHIDEPTEADVETARFVLEAKRAGSLTHLVPKKVGRTDQAIQHQIIDSRQANRVQNNKLYQTYTFLCEPSQVY